MGNYLYVGIICFICWNAWKFRPKDHVNHIKSIVSMWSLHLQTMEQSVQLKLFFICICMSVCHCAVDTQRINCVIWKLSTGQLNLKWIFNVMIDRKKTTTRNDRKCSTFSGYWAFSASSPSRRCFSSSSFYFVISNISIFYCFKCVIKWCESPFYTKFYTSTWKTQKQQQQHHCSSAVFQQCGISHFRIRFLLISFPKCYCSLFLSRSPSRE